MMNESSRFEHYRPMDFYTIPIATLSDNRTVCAVRHQFHNLSIAQRELQGATVRIYFQNNTNSSEMKETPAVANTTTNSTATKSKPVTSNSTNSTTTKSKPDTSNSHSRCYIEFTVSAVIPTCPHQRRSAEMVGSVSGVPSHSGPVSVSGVHSTSSSSSSMSPPVHTLSGSPRLSSSTSKSPSTIRSCHGGNTSSSIMSFRESVLFAGINNTDLTTLSGDAAIFTLPRNMSCRSTHYQVQRTVDGPFITSEQLFNTSVSSSPLISTTSASGSPSSAQLSGQTSAVRSILSVSHSYSESSLVSRSPPTTSRGTFYSEEITRTRDYKLCVLRQDFENMTEAAELLNEKTLRLFVDKGECFVMFRVAAPLFNQTVDLTSLCPATQEAGGIMTSPSSSPTHHPSFSTSFSTTTSVRITQS